MGESGAGTRAQRIGRAVGIGAAIIALGLGVVVPAGAASRFVATTGSDGANTCLDSANPCRTITRALSQAVAADTITVAAGTYNLALGETFPLVINVSLTLTGAGPGSTIIDATGASQRVITSHAAAVTIKGTTIMGGLVTCTVDDGGCTAAGAGLSNDGTLTLINSTISGNTAICTNNGGGGCTAKGGALFNNGAVIVANSTLHGNTARCSNTAGFCQSFGGGISNEGSATLVNSAVSGNVARCSNGGSQFCLANGGGLLSDGPLTLTNSTVTGNTAFCSVSGGGFCSIRGGGLNIPLGSSASVTNGTVSGNTATCTVNGSSRSECGVNGGGVSNGGILTVTNSTVSGNTVSCLNTSGAVCGASGGGLGNIFSGEAAGALSITNSTVSGNTATCTSTSGDGSCGGSGGGFLNETEATIASSTVTANSVTCSGTGCTAVGGGIRNDDGSLTLKNTIVANSPSGGNCSGTVGSLGHNLSSDASCAFAGPGDLNATNPLLGSLQNNGGPTETHALLPGSPAIDAGTNSGCPATDQRGFRRPVDGGGDPTAVCDIGAFERNTVATTLLGAVLPTERTAQAGVTTTTVTAFATVLNLLNTGVVTALGCAIAPFTPVDATFLYQTTNVQNALIGTANTPADIPAGQGQNFFFAFTPTRPFARTEVQLSFACTNTAPAPIISGVNTFLLRASLTPAPDIVALVATAPPNDGIVRLASAGAFAVATVNLGAPGLLTVSANTGSAILPVTLSLCETNPQSGQCLAPPAPTVQSQINTGATPTFGVFVNATGPIPFAPGTNRIQVRFEGGGGGGGTGVAVCTAPLCP